MEQTSHLPHRKLGQGCRCRVLTPGRQYVHFAKVAKEVSIRVEDPAARPVPTRDFHQWIPLPFELVSCLRPNAGAGLQHFDHAVAILKAPVA